MRRLPPATAGEHELVERLLGEVQDLIARRETMAPGETILFEGVPTSREMLDKLARANPDTLRRIAREALAWKRQILFEEGSD